MQSGRARAVATGADLVRQLRDGGVWAPAEGVQKHRGAAKAKLAQREAPELGGDGGERVRPHAQRHKPTQVLDRVRDLFQMRRYS